MDTLPRRMKDAILRRERPGNLTGDATAEETHCPAGRAHFGVEAQPSWRDTPQSVLGPATPVAIIRCDGDG
ncbi:MAG: hypothetical protein WBC55_02020 [Dehalococcoidia bacterium]